MLFLQFVELFFKFIVGLLIAAAILWGLPSLFLMIQDEVEEKHTVLTTQPATARHRRAPGVVDDWMQQRVVEFRNVRTKAQKQGHRANMAWAELAPMAGSFFSSMTIREPRELNAA